MPLTHVETWARYQAQIKYLTQLQILYIGKLSKIWLRKLISVVFSRTSRHYCKSSKKEFGPINSIPDSTSLYNAIDLSQIFELSVISYFLFSRLLVQAQISGIKWVRYQDPLNYLTQLQYNYIGKLSKILSWIP